MSLKSHFPGRLHSDIVLPEKIDPEDEVVIYASKYLKKLTQILATTERRVLANYILMRFIRHRINNLGRTDRKQNN